VRGSCLAREPCAQPVDAERKSNEPQANSRSEYDEIATAMEHPHRLVRRHRRTWPLHHQKFETEWLLKLNGELIGRFKSPDEARACAEVGVKTAREVEERL
jgi:hypothetical protein